MRKHGIIASLFALTFAGVASAAEKPTPPTLTIPAVPPVNACADPATRTALIGSFEQNVQAAMEYGGAVNAYSQKLNEWKSAQLIEKKVWTEANESNFSLALLGDQTFMGMVTQGMTDVMALPTSMEAFDKAKAAKDDGKACTAAVDGLTAIDRMMAGVRKQWDFIGARYDAEAKRLGVTID